MDDFAPVRKARKAPSLRNESSEGGQRNESGTSDGITVARSGVMMAWDWANHVRRNEDESK